MTRKKFRDAGTPGKDRSLAEDQYRRHLTAVVPRSDEPIEKCGNNGLSIVKRLRGFQHHPYLVPKFFGLQDFDVASVSQDIHQEFGWVAVGHFQKVIPLGVELPPLIRMPFLIRDPVGGIRRKSQLGALLGLSAINAVAGIKDRIQLRFRYFLGGLVCDLDPVDGINGEFTQGLPAMAPRFEVPIISVVGQSLRR